eukprot:snap_masked-scaffold263_size232787-processed-gene-0.5 protein:Tk11194 transcript:snap_masked-scaffold263_size232787-processed-gene-0.5-mRNA-1 annotation:"6-phosphofructo-2-kinase fructose- -biphosphatase 3"
MASVLSTNLKNLIPTQYPNIMCVEENDEDKPSAETAQDSAAAEDDADPFTVLHENIVPREGRTVFFTRHGESEYNVQERIGGDPTLTPRGNLYAKALGQYINALAMDDVKIITSTLCRTILTAKYIKGPRSETDILNEINSGYLDGLTYKEIQKKYPDEYMAREKDKLNYRYPGGESYVDCCRRVMPILVKMEEEDNLVIVAHQAILRCFFGYLLKRPMVEVPQIKIPQHAIMQKKYPDEYMAREKDKLNYRYPGGESYVDCCRRVMPILVKMEEEDNLVIVAHQAILRCFFGYLLKRPMVEVPQIKIPQHAIMQVTFEGDENVVDFIRMPIDHIEQGVLESTTD